MSASQRGPRALWSQTINPRHASRYFSPIVSVALLRVESSRRCAEEPAASLDLLFGGLVRRPCSWSSHVRVGSLSPVMLKPFMLKVC